jgi:hypothetical protein
MADSRARFESLLEEKLSSMSVEDRDAIAATMEQVREALSQ